MDTAHTLTTDDFDRMTREDDWLGFGYLGRRRNALDNSDPEVPAAPEVVDQVDAVVLAHANARGLTYADLFAWANSKDGRWFADSTLWAGVTEAQIDAAARGFLP